ncbi:hypothetical protein M2401_002762 [Pseudomonas sp. JUb42]|jgi:hypothetical protein|uniref:Cap15 family cyclic dinucleotide receptor domain-containing protein n=1 Tax=Pseudomonas sp. JUb42 TaxID=2940611 RepID=UPI00216AA2AB|nr:hypothetical protein [Pseudomonas sp. JUb42]MCS3469024.1 hypothetical protein [Pseudomonas sp. JUb42]
MSLHTYSVNDLLNSTERTQALYKLAAGASVIVGTIASIFAWITTYWGASIALTAPAAVVVYLFMVRRVELDLWKNNLVRIVLGISLPNINGRWKATVQRRNRNGQDLQDSNDGEMYIFQTWSTLGVQFETEFTSSHSTGGFLTQGGHHLVLTIEYQADLRDPYRDNVDIQAHKGVSKFKIPMKDDGEFDLLKIEVPYYTDHRETGMIKLERILVADS